jgi:uncharacterized protein YacL
MLQLSPELLSLRIYIAISLIVTFLVDFLVVRYLLKSTPQTPTDTSDKKQKSVIVWSIGIIPGLLVFVFLSMSTLLNMGDTEARAFAILVFTILDIIASFSGGMVASLSTKPRIEVDFNLESDT